MRSFGRFDLTQQDGKWVLRVRSPAIARWLAVLCALLAIATVPLGFAGLVEKVLLLVVQLFAGLVLFLIGVIRTTTPDVPGAMRLLHRSLVVKDGAIEADGKSFPFSSVKQVLVAIEVNPTPHGGTILLHRVLIVLEDGLIDTGGFPNPPDARALCQELRTQLKLAGAGPKPAPLPPVRAGMLWLAALVILAALGPLMGAPLSLIGLAMNGHLDPMLLAASAAAVLATALGGGWLFGRSMRGSMLKRGRIVRSWALAQ